MPDADGQLNQQLRTASRSLKPQHHLGTLAPLQGCALQMDSVRLLMHPLNLVNVAPGADLRVLNGTLSSPPASTAPYVAGSLGLIRGLGGGGG